MTCHLRMGAISADANDLAADLLRRLLRGSGGGSAPASVKPPRAQATRSTSLLGFARMLAAAAVESRRRDLGLDMACVNMAPTPSIFGELFVHAPTVGEALQALTRYFPVVQTHTTCELTRSQDVARFTYNINDRMVVDRFHDAAYTLGKIYRSLRRCVGEDWNLDHVVLAAPLPDTRESYRCFFQAPVTFGAESNALCFSSNLLERPIASADAHRYARFCARLEGMMPGCSDPDVLEDALRAWMLHVRGWGHATLEQAAADFGVTPRTMQRRLKEQGIGFQALLAQVRMESAQRMLTQSRMSVSQVAEQLGFSETSAFTRAFRSHAHQSPRAFRQAAFAPV